MRMAVRTGAYRDDGTLITFDLTAPTTLPADRFHTGKRCPTCSEGSFFPVNHPTRRPCTMRP